MRFFIATNTIIFPKIKPISNVTKVLDIRIQNILERCWEIKIQPSLYLNEKLYLLYR